MVWKSDLCCVRRANQINSSNWLMATSFWPRLSVDYSISVVAKCIFIFWAFFVASRQSQPLSLITKHTTFNCYFLRRFVVSLKAPTTQVNYIRFINLASSVSRREGKEWNQQQGSVNFEQGKKPCGTGISMKANKNQTTWLSFVLLFAAIYCFLSLVRFNVPKERIITVYRWILQNRLNQSHSNHSDEKLFIAKEKARNKNNKYRTKREKSGK